MSEQDNKAIVREIYAAMANGDRSVFGRHVHPDYVWRVAGRASWSGEYVGQDAIRRELLGPLFGRFTTTYTAQLKSIVSEGETVVAEVEGDVMTKDGARYDNLYCFIFRFREGRIAEVTEYADTDLGERVLGPYAAALAAFGTQA